MAKRASKAMQQQQQTEQQPNQTVIAAAVQEAIAEAAKPTADYRLNESEEKHATAYGEALGNMSKARTGLAITLRDMGIELQNFRMEGYPFDVNPRQEAFIRAILAHAWEVAYGKGAKFKITSDQTLNNAATGLRNLCRAYNLQGFLDRDGEPVQIVKGLTDILNRDPRDPNVPGGWNKAVSKAREYIQNAKDKAENDSEFAELIGLDKQTERKGRPLEPLSTTRIASIVKDAPRLQPAQAAHVIVASVDRLGTDDAAKVLDAMVKHLLELIPADAETPKAKALAEKARAWVQQHGTEFASKATKLVREARAAIIQPAKPESAATPTPTHIDEVTAARGRKRTARKVPAKVITETMQASA